MSKRPKQKMRNDDATLSSLTKSVALLRSQMRIGNQEIQTDWTQIQQEMRTGFDQIYRHIDGFVIRISPWHLGQVGGSAS